jgi:hypothetical protein
MPLSIPPAADAARLAPVLIVGGSGVVGRQAAQALRRLQPDLPITLGGRDLAKATAVAGTIARTDAVAIDLGRADLGLAPERRFSAIAMFVKDDRLNSLRHALQQGLPYVSISTGSFEIGPEVAHYIRQPQRAPVLMLSHWLAGVTSLPTLEFAKAFERVDVIEIGAVLDEQDMGGPAAYIDYERITGAAQSSLILKDGEWQWATGALATRRFIGSEGIERQAQPYAPLDGPSLAAATGAHTIRFDLEVGETAARRRGEHFSTEIVIEIEGLLKDGSTRRVRHEIVHPAGQAPLTAIGVAVAVERLLGLAGGAAVPPGLYSPDTLIAPGYMLQRMREAGALIHSA